MRGQQFGQAEYNAVKTATKLLVQDLGGVDAAAACTGVGRSQLSDYGALAQAEKFVPADVIMDLEKVAGAPRVTAALAAAQGFGLVLIEARRDRGALATLLAELGRDCAQLFATAAGALGHLTPTDAEREALALDLNALRLVCEESMFWLKHRAPGGDAQ